MADDQERETITEALHARIDGDMLLGGGGWGPDGWVDDIPHDKARISDLVRWATNAILAEGWVSPSRHAEVVAERDNALAVANSMQHFADVAERLERKVNEVYIPRAEAAEAERDGLDVRLHAERELAHHREVRAEAAEAEAATLRRQVEAVRGLVETWDDFEHDAIACPEYNCSDCTMVNAIYDLRAALDGAGPDGGA